MKSIIGKILTAVVIIGIMAFTVNKLFDNKKAVEEKVYRKNPEAKPLVQVVTVEEQPLSVNLQLLGTFQPNRQIDIVSEAQGKVVEAGIEKGDAVGAGTVIARLDTDVLQAQLIAVKAQYEKAQLDVKRYENIVAGDAMPKMQLEQASLALKSAESQLKLLQKQISQATITAPFGGVITKRMFDYGSVVSPGMPLATLTDISKLKLTINVPEREVITIKKNQLINIQTDLYPDQTFKGKVITIASSGDAAHNFEVEVLIDNTDRYPLKAGMYGYTLIDNTSNTSVLAIPRTALIGSAKNPQVYVVENGVAKLKSIVIGAGSGDRLQVISGLSKDEAVVVSGQANLADNTAVNVTK